MLSYSDGTPDSNIVYRRFARRSFVIIMFFNVFSIGGDRKIGLDFILYSLLKKRKFFLRAPQKKRTTGRKEKEIEIKTRRNRNFRKKYWKVEGEIERAPLPDA